jgi:hypothetical protein
VAEELAGGAGEEDVVARLPGHRLDPGGDVDGVADDAVVEAAAAADRAGHHPARVDADADREQAGVAVIDDLRHLHRAAHGAIGVVGVALGRPEDREQPVADELVDVTTVTGDDRDHGLELGVEPGYELLRVRLCGEAGEVPHVAEEDGDVNLEALRGEAVAEVELRHLAVQAFSGRRWRKLRISATDMVIAVHPAAITSVRPNSAPEAS